MTEPVTRTEERRLPTLTSLRWYAALLVFVYHFEQNAKWKALDGFTWGYAGVAFFFVLSGFVLTWSASPKLKWRRFWWRRFARIYPSHIVMFVVTAIITSFITFHYLVRGTGPAITQILLIHAWWPQGAEIGYNSPSWSLSDEAFFYLCFPFALLLFSRMRVLGGVVVLLALVAGGIYSYEMGTHGLLSAATAQFNPLARLPEFLLGMWLALRLRSNPGFRIPMWFGLVVTVALAVWTWQDLLVYYPATNYVMIVGFALLIVSGACADRRGSQELVARFFRLRASIYLGEVSFAFYLTHWLTINALKGPLVIRPGISARHAAAGMIVMAVIAFAGAVALHHLVELPAQRWLTRKRTVARQASTPQRVG